MLRGTPDLRTPGGWRTLEEGEIVAFGTGEEGAHQLLNRTDADVRFLALSSSGSPDVVIYPDSGKVLARERRPDGGGGRFIFRQADAVGSWDGEPESPPQPE